MEILDGAGESLNLDPRYESLPLDALRRSSRTKISLYLDEPSEIVDEESGYVTDWNGLAELIGFTCLEMKKFGRQKSPTQDLLNDWGSNPELKPTLGHLWKYLIELGRLDVLQDAKSNVSKYIYILCTILHTRYFGNFLTSHYRTIFPDLVAH